MLYKEVIVMKIYINISIDLNIDSISNITNIAKLFSTLFTLYQLLS